MNEWGMWFSPTTLKINIDWEVIKAASQWRRQAIALYIHELTHLYDWIITYNRDSDAWNDGEEYQEHRANSNQDTVLNLLGVTI